LLVVLGSQLLDLLEFRLGFSGPAEALKGPATAF
jgi:hypothetical protein